MSKCLTWWLRVCVLVQAATEGEGVKEYLYKVLVVGDIGVGKTSIIKRKYGAAAEHADGRG